MNLTDITQALKAAAAKACGTCEDEETVQARLLICSHCPEARPACNLLERSSLAIGTGAIAGNVCGICRCSLELLCSARKRHLHLETPEQKEKRPDHCWIRSI